MAQFAPNPQMIRVRLILDWGSKELSLDQQYGLIVLLKRKKERLLNHIPELDMVQ